jgi:predicted transcriptional regulator
MRDWSKLPLRIFLAEEKISQSKAASIFSLSQAAISQMCLSDRDIVVLSDANSDDNKLVKLVEIKELAVGSIS